MPGGKLLLGLSIGDDALLDGIDEEHAAWLEATLFADVFRGNVEHPGLRGHHDQVVLGDDVAAGAETVAV